MYNVEDIRNIFIEKLANEEFTIDKTGVKTIEIVGANFTADSDRIFGTPNEDYQKRELAWYKSESLYVADIPGKTPKIWEDVSSKLGSHPGKINSNYGWCIFSHSNYNQYESALETLLADKDSRRAIMIYTRPSMQVDYNYNGMSDFMCTSTTHHMIRDDALTSIVTMRSNDAIYGYLNDFFWQEYVHNKLAHDLGVDPGPIVWQAGSIHVYERHFDLVK